MATDHGDGQHPEPPFTARLSPWDAGEKVAAGKGVQGADAGGGDGQPSAGGSWGQPLNTSIRSGFGAAST